MKRGASRVLGVLVAVIVVCFSCGASAQELKGKTLLSNVESYLQATKIKYTAIPARSAVTFSMAMTNGQWQCFGHAREEEKMFLFYSVWPIRVPLDKRSAVAEFITRANFGMNVGNFEIDLDDGELRYKTSIDLADGILTSKIVERVLGICLVTADRYLPGLTKVTYGGMSPKAAISEIEK